MLGDGIPHINHILGDIFFQKVNVIIHNGLSDSSGGDTLLHTVAGNEIQTHIVPEDKTRKPGGDDLKTIGVVHSEVWRTRRGHNLTVQVESPLMVIVRLIGQIIQGNNVDTLLPIGIAIPGGIPTETVECLFNCTLEKLYPQVDGDGIPHIELVGTSDKYIGLVILADRLLDESKMTFMNRLQTGQNYSYRFHILFVKYIHHNNPI